MPMGKQLGVLHGLHSRDQSVDALFEFVDAALFRIVCALQIGDLSGHRECLKYAHENGCPWDEDTCEAATEDGHLGCLKYAHENGCPWDESVCEAVAGRGQLLRTFKLLRREALKKRDDVSMTTSPSPARRRVVPAFLKLDFC